MKPFLTVYSTLLASPSTLFSHNISYAVSVMIKRFGNIRLICSEEAGAIYTCYCHTHCNSASELTQPIHYLFHFFSFVIFCSMIFLSPHHPQPAIRHLSSAGSVSQGSVKNTNLYRLSISMSYCLHIQKRCTHGVSWTDKASHPVCRNYRSCGHLCF